MATKDQNAIEALCDTVDALAGPGLTIILEDHMTREQKKHEIYKGFCQEGYPHDEAEEKAWEMLEVLELSMAPETLPN